MSNAIIAMKKHIKQDQGTILNEIWERINNCPRVSLAKKGQCILKWHLSINFLLQIIFLN
jgi:hypothetical protein